MTPTAAFFFLLHRFVLVVGVIFFFGVFVLSEPSRSKGGLWETCTFLLIAALTAHVAA